MRALFRLFQKLFGPGPEAPYIGPMTTDLKPDYRRAKSEAAKLLDQFGLTKPPIDPVRMARALGIEVYFADFGTDNQNVSGFYDFEENAIFVNKDEFAPRQTFTVAHELGHKILHSEWVKSADYRVLLRDQLADGSDPIEKEANVFAAALLVPKVMLDVYRKVASISELADLFAVSEPVIRNRIKIEYGA